MGSQRPPGIVKRAQFSAGGVKSIACVAVGLAVFTPAFVCAGPEPLLNTTPTPNNCGSQFSADGPVVEIVNAFSPTVVPLPADKEFTGDGLITQYVHSTTEFQYAAHLTLRGAYDDNIALTHINRLDDRFVQIQSSLMLGLGDVARQTAFIAGIYIPSFYRYDEHSDFNSDQHVAHILGGIQTGNLTIKISQDISSLNNIVLASTSEERSALGTLNGRTNIESYDAKLNARYNLTRADFFALDLRLNAFDYTFPLVGFEQSTVDLYFNHNFTKELVLGIGAQGGYDEVEFPTPDQTFVQANAHLNYTPSNRFNIDVIAGAEFRDFENPGRNTYTTPVFQISAAMLPCDSLRIILAASRGIYNSAAALVAQDYVETTVTGTIRERVCKQLYLSLIGGYSHLDDFNTIDRPISPPTLSDDYYYVQPAVDVLLTRYWSIGAYYLRRENSASISTADFASNQYGGRMSIKF
jgi:hypothetical protein